MEGIVFHPQTPHFDWRKMTGPNSSGDYEKQTILESENPSGGFISSIVLHYASRLTLCLDFHVKTLV